MTYTDWSPSSGYTNVHQPDGADVEDCVMIRLDSIHDTRSWHDIPCAYDKVQQFLCETAIQVGESQGQSEIEFIHVGESQGQGEIEFIQVGESQGQGEIEFIQVGESQGQGEIEFIHVGELHGQGKIEFIHVGESQ